MFDKVLIANRGAIATRIIRTLKTMNVKSVAVYHQADANSLHVQQADEAYCLGNGTAAETYLNQDLLIEIAKQCDANAIHPGYGFLSENTEFVELCERHNVTFIGPTTTQILQFGLKHEARDLAEKANVPLVPGSPLLTEVAEACQWAEKIGYPVILKSTAGGGGIGMQICRSKLELTESWGSVKRLGANYFSNDGVFLEKFIESARHIEVQIFGDGEGNVVSLGERDCSAQRRNQKVIEETPAPNLPEELRTLFHKTAERLMASVQYRNAGTVEFILDTSTNQFYFLEVNTRLQVEHGVTEEVWGVDLVEWMIKLAAKDLPALHTLRSPLKPTGHAIQVRIYAENPDKDFQPSSGLLSQVEWPSAQKVRIDTWVESGTAVPALFDPMIAKIIAIEKDRPSAMETLKTALLTSSLYGIETNKDYVSHVLDSVPAQTGELRTNTLADFAFSAPTVNVLKGGTQSTLQDFPGRSGYWDVGVPPSGPMDSVNFRLANQLLKNAPESVALEVLLNGPTLMFNIDTNIAITGAQFDVMLDDLPVPMNQVVQVKAGHTLSMGRVCGDGARAYLAIDGGFQCPEYLGSRSTFTLGQFGGHVGRALKTGDVLRIQPSRNYSPAILNGKEMPTLSENVELRVVYGPHGAPDFFTEADIEAFLSATWEVHYNSSRTGIRLIGPKPKWARETGGEAGMHPSNIHDNAYAFGTVDFTGDMPVILGPDGPSLGGFVCPATVITADLWKLGQLKAGHKVKFIPVSLNDAVELEAMQNESIAHLNWSNKTLATAPLEHPIRYETSWQNESVKCRVAGDHFLLIELGELELDIARRFRVHALMLALKNHQPSGVREITPGIRSLQIHYDSQTLSLNDITDWIGQTLTQLDHQRVLSVPSRIVHLPLSWDDTNCQLAIEKYMQSVRPGAPWCPSNIEFIRRINGLGSIEEVKKIVFDANYLVLGLGDVYLGAPVATPIDPRHRMVTTKYNPARTWTAENSVGIGGAYMCVYGMEGPGGYQFVGRTSQMWNRYHQTDVFTQPWLLRFFDQIKFYPVSETELQEIREKLPLGQFPLKIEESEFRLDDYLAFIEKNESSIQDFQSSRAKAFEEELQQWKKNGQLTYEQSEERFADLTDEQVPEDVLVTDSPVSGNVWKVLVGEGDNVKMGDVLIILESMKMEIEIQAQNAGTVSKLLVNEGHSIESGQALAWIKEY